MHIEKADAAWKASLASIDQSPDRGATVAAELGYGAGGRFHVYVRPFNNGIPGRQYQVSAEAGSQLDGVPMERSCSQTLPTGI